MKNNNNKKTVSKRVVTNHAFRGCKEALLVVGTGGANPGTNVFVAASDSTGAGRCSWVLAPVGLTTATLASGLFNIGGTFNTVTPPLRNLYNRAVNFQWYRVTRAKLIFVSNQGSTIAGQLALYSYTDPMDISSGTYAAQISSQSTKVFDLASGTSREMSIPVPVDSSWKKVSAMLTFPASAYPFALPTASGVVVANTVTDLAFAGVGASWYGVNLNGAAAVTNLGSFFIDYDVEFKAPIDPLINY